MPTEIFFLAGGTPYDLSHPTPSHDHPDLQMAAIYARSLGRFVPLWVVII